MKRVYAKENLCIDCKLCEIHCKKAHSKSKDIIKAYKFEKPEPVSRIVVEGDRIRSIAVSCRHCEKPNCVKACITGAMTKDPQTGIVTNDASRCIGCMTCLSACPFGIIRVGDVALKCDLCQEEHEPECVKACPNGALVFIEGRSWK